MVDFGVLGVFGRDIWFGFGWIDFCVGGRWVVCNSLGYGKGFWLFIVWILDGVKSDNI